VTFGDFQPPATFLDIAVTRGPNKFTQDREISPWHEARTDPGTMADAFKPRVLVTNS